MVSQKDIAKKLNISRSLVSKVLNDNLGTTKVNEQTKEAIISLARQMGYRPNPVARALVTGRQNTIGVAIRRFGNPASRQADAIADGIVEVALANNQKLILTFYVDDTESRCLDFLTENDRIDGLILGGTVPDDLAERLPGFDSMPVVTVCCQKIPKVAHVNINNPKMGQIATEHLIAQGCRKIATIRSWDMRHEGFVAACKKAGLKIDPRLIFDADDFLHSSGQCAVEHFLAEGLEFDAIFAQSDQQAAGVINSLLGKKIQVPQQVKVVGIDNASFCDFSIRPITSVDPNLQTAGAQAMKTLLKMIENPNLKPAEIEIEPTLVQRESSR